MQSYLKSQKYHITIDYSGNGRAFLGGVGAPGSANGIKAEGRQKGRNGHRWAETEQ